MEKEKKIHLVKEGDSLTGFSKVECGIKTAERAVFGFDGTKNMVTCKICQNSKAFKEIE